MIDIGANLTNESFRSDLPEVLDRARSAGIDTMIVTGTTLAESRSAHQLACEHPGLLYATAGLHPHHADSYDVPMLEELETLLGDPLVLAVGETGLDYNRNFSTQANQRHAFEQHLQLAERVGKPLFLHERDAFSDFYDMMVQYPALCPNAVVHCFTGSMQALKSYLDLGMYIGITGWICDRKRGENLRNIVRYAPLDRLMIETDAPYLTPHKEKLRELLAHKHRNEPWTLTHTAAALAKALDISLDKLILATRENSERFFRLPAKQITSETP